MGWINFEDIKTISLLISLGVNLYLVNTWRRVKRYEANENFRCAYYRFRILLSRYLQRLELLEPECAIIQNDFSTLVGELLDALAEFRVCFFGYMGFPKTMKELCLTRLSIADEIIYQASDVIRSIQEIKGSMQEYELASLEAMCLDDELRARVKKLRKSYEETKTSLHSRQLEIIVKLGLLDRNM